MKEKGCKKVKKVLSVILAAVMFVCMTATAAFAAEGAKLDNGVYVLYSNVVKSNSDEKALADNIIQPRVKVTVNGDQMTLELTVQNLDSLDFKIGNLSVKVSDGKGGYNEAQVIKTFANGYPELMTVPLPSTQEYIPVKIDLGIPGVSEDARLKLNWNGAQ